MVPVDDCVDVGALDREKDKYIRFWRNMRKTYILSLYNSIYTGYNLGMS